MILVAGCGNGKSEKERFSELAMSCPHVAFEVNRCLHGPITYREPVVFKDRYPSYLGIEVLETVLEECLLCGALRQVKHHEDGHEMARTDWNMGRLYPRKHGLGARVKSSDVEPASKARQRNDRLLLETLLDRVPQGPLQQPYLAAHPRPPAPRLRQLKLPF